MLHPLLREVEGASGCASSPRRSPSARVSRTRRCYSSSRRSTRSSGAGSSRWRPRTPTRATPPRRRAGTWALSGSRSSEPRRPLGVGASPRPRTSSASGRALDVLAAGGLVWASAAALAGADPTTRPASSRSARGRVSRASRAGGDAALAGYERVERVDDRGQFAGARWADRHLPDDRPRADPRRALRRRDRAGARVRRSATARAATRSTTRSSIRRPSAGSTRSIPTTACCSKKKVKLRLFRRVLCPYSTVRPTWRSRRGETSGSRSSGATTST